MTERIALALLAAGRSRRFGAADKLGADLGGKKLIDWAAQAGRRVDAIRFVITALAFDLALDGYDRLVNEEADEGMGTSLRLAARAAHEADASALLVMLADMPFVTAAHLRSVIDAATGQPVFSQRPGGAPQPPALFPSGFFPALEAMTGDAGARSLAASATIVPADTDMLIDIDTPDDLAHAHQAQHLLQWNDQA